MSSDGSANRPNSGTFGFHRTPISYDCRYIDDRYIRPSAAVSRGHVPRDRNLHVNVKVVVSSGGMPSPDADPRRSACCDPGGRRRDRPDDPCDPLLRGDRPARAAARSDGDYRLYDAVRPRAAALHPQPARRRRVLARPDRPAARGRGRPRAEPRAVPGDRGPGRAARAPERRPRSGSSARSRPSRRRPPAWRR